MRDIASGEEITDDYATLNSEEPFACLRGLPNCRGQVLPDDPERCGSERDRLIAGAFPAIEKVDQPLWELVREKVAIRRVLSGEIALPWILNHYRLAAKIQMTQA